MPSSEGVEAVIDLQSVRKVYRTETIETHALVGVSLRVQRGEYVAFCGPSGSGKSTLLAVLGLLEAPTSGTYLLDGKVASALSSEERAKARNSHIGFVFQSFNLIGDLTVTENVALPLRYGGVPARDAQLRARGALARVGLPHRMSHYPSQLSGGQQQRVAVARALVTSPALVLADEPTGNLDSTSAGVVMDLLDDIHSTGTTVCMVTHDPNHAARATRQVFLRDGSLVEG